VTKNKGVMVLLVLVCGWIGGFVLSELIGIVGLLSFDKAIGIKYLPFILPIVCAVIALLIVGKWNSRK
jgi:uncharacterized membrane protein YeaQ/YmgE (transglycosylase-associated protein family)